MRRRKPGEKSRRSQNTVFINVPYDQKYEDLYLAYIAGLCSFGLIPRATVEIPGSHRRLDRIIQLIQECPYSFHDLSHVTLDRNKPRAPRFNMPFELGLAVCWAKLKPKQHHWFVFEARNFRLTKSLSDLGGTDPYIHRGDPIQLLRALTNALVRSKHQPTVQHLEKVYLDIKRASSIIKNDLETNTLFEARPFKEIVIAATASAQNRIPSLASR